MADRHDQQTMSRWDELKRRVRMEWQELRAEDLDDVPDDDRVALVRRIQERTGQDWEAVSRRLAASGGTADLRSDSLDQPGQFELDDRNGGTMSAEWESVKRLARQRWAALTDDDMEVDHDDYDDLAARISVRTGESAESVLDIIRRSNS